MRLDLSGPIATLTLTHPSARNALSPAMMLELQAAVAELEEWPGALVLVRGAGERSFCAGSDLRAVRAAIDSPRLAAAMADFMGALTQRITALPQLTLALVQGAAVGGGAELMCCFDLRVIEESARVQFVHAHLGLSPGWGGAARLAALVGRSKALRWMASAAPIELRQTPALWELLPQTGQGEAAAMELLETMARNPCAGVRGAKAALRSPEAERAAFLDLWGGPAQRAALASLDIGRT